MPAVKVGNCHYCGTRAALVLSGEKRHELACATCGAPLHDLKMMPKPEEKSTPKPQPRPAPTSHHRAMSGKSKYKKTKKKKSFKRKMMGELWDLVEDIFD